MESNKIFNLLDKAIQILDRCWKGYKPVAGVKPYAEGSCEKEMATQSDMSEIEEVIAMLDKAINFYDPSQERDSSGKWSGSGGMSPDKGSPSGGSSSSKNAEVVSEKVNDKLDDFISENSDDMEDGGDYEDESNYHPIARFMRASEGWIGSNIPDKTTGAKVKSGLGKLISSINAVTSMYGSEDGTFGGAFAKLGEYFEKMSDDAGYTTYNKKGKSGLQESKKAIEFYEPTQPRDERGRWDGGSGGLMISKEEASKITSQEKAYDAISSQLADAKKSVEEIDDNAFIKIQQIGYKLRDMQGNSDQNYYSTIMATAREVANIADKLVNSGQKEARDSSVIFRGATEAMQEIAQAFRSNWNKK